ncbi:MAG TPA: transposase [Kofleriaceae bacterium]
MRRAHLPEMDGYTPRLAERSVLHAAVRENVETFLARCRERSEHGFGVPRFVDDELRGFLRCGVLAYGFVRVRCGTCGDELLVGFSCKGRAVCPSCSGRRASECATRLVDAVLPAAPVRQWVLTFPHRLRFALARDANLCTKVIGIWLRALESDHRRRAKREGFATTRGGAVTFSQRFGSALNLNVHFHTVRPDGVFTVPAPDEARPAFVALDPPSRADIEALLARVVRRVRRCVERHIEGRDDDVGTDALAALAASSVAGRGRTSETERGRGRFEAFLDGFSLHAGVHLHENDRAGIERVCRHGARGPLTLGRLTRDDDGRFRYRMKRTVRGRDELVITGLELVEKLAALIPPPRIHLIRFHGVLAPNAALRPLVVPAKPTPPAPIVDAEAIPLPPLRPSPFRIDWASLLKRVFAVDVLACRRCEGRMRILAVIDQPEPAKKILDHLGLPSVGVETAPARGPPQPSFAFDVA